MARNSLNAAKQIQIVDWLRQHNDDLPNMTSDEITAAIAEQINNPVTLAQVRNLAKAANLRWAIKIERQRNPNSQAGKIGQLEDRVAQLEEAVQILDGQLFALINIRKQA